jgi:NADPH:quinone reductase-like Zn-dependent oxidoreductase
MTAAVLTAFGGPETLVVRGDVRVPRPEPDEVLVQVSAAGVNNTDIWTRQGAYGRPGDPDAVAGWRGVPLSFPRIQGADIAGRIVDVGMGVEQTRIGERVMVDPAIFEDTEAEPELVAVVGSERDGGFAQYVAVPASSAHDVTLSPLSDMQLACIPIAYGTAMGMLERASVRAGEHVLVTGASGGLGYALIQLSLARGAVVTALSTSSQVDFLSETGVQELISRDRPDWRTQLESGRTFDVVADVVGDGVFEAVLPCLRTGGRLVTAGAIAGPLVTLDLRVLYLRQRQIIGSTMHTPDHFRMLIDAVRTGAIDPVVAATYPLDEIHAAQDRFLRKDFTGKLVIIP